MAHVPDDDDLATTSLTQYDNIHSPFHQHQAAVAPSQILYGPRATNCFKNFHESPVKLSAFEH